MVIKSTEQQLEEVQAAIEQALASQEMSGGRGRVRRPDLDTLYKQEDRLRKRLSAERGENFAANIGILREDS